MNAAEHEEARRIPFWIGLGVGWAMIGMGLVLLVTTGGFGHVVDVGIWVVGLDLVHDVALAPVATAVALVVVAVLPGRLRAPILAGLGASAVVVLLAWPLLGGYGRRRDNPTVLPRNYTTSVLVVLAVIWIVAIAWLVVRAVRRRRVEA